MIWDSVPWKRALLHDADLLERWAIKVRFAARRDLIIERKIFLSAYAARKLFEAEKLSTKLRDVEIPCLKYPRSGSELGPWNWDDITKHFDFERGEPFDLNARTLMDQIIHSYVFVLMTNVADEITGFFVASDREKDRQVAFVTLAAFCAFIRTVGSDDPAHSLIRRDARTGGWKITSW